MQSSFLEQQLDQSITITKTNQPETVVVDYSSPNIAKELHVGHLRSTVIGDAIVGMLELVGHNVIKQNHVGDWGTTFGKLIAQLKECDATETTSIQDLETLYIESSQRFESDPVFAQQAREAVTRLQQKDPDTLLSWQSIVRHSVDHIQDMYSQLNVKLERSDIRGESSYAEDLPQVIDDLKDAELITKSDGALCVFVDGFKRPDGEPLPMLVQKADGGYLYHTTDLAALKHRTQNLKADRLIYLTDGRQIDHFKLLFAVGKLVGYVPEHSHLQHIVFGSILNSQGEPFKTRAGSNVLLRNLIEEGTQRSLAVVQEKSSHLPQEEQHNIARIIAIGAIKYADLSKNRTSDYRFDWEIMLSLDGNTSPYLQYAYARICSIFTKAKRTQNSCSELSVQITEPSERALALRLLRFPEVLEHSVFDMRPNHLCNYLYELTVHFMRFYEQCRVIGAPSPAIRDSRLGLCYRTATVLHTGLSCMGISTLERM